MKLFGMTKMSLVALVATISAPALAENKLSYSFVEAQYIDTEIDDFNVDGDGLGLVGSVALGEHFFIGAGYADLDYDRGIDSQQRSVFVGAHTPINSSTDLVGSIGYTDVNLDSRFGSADVDGYTLGLGVRSMVLEDLELNAGVKYVDLDEDGDNTSFSLGGRYYVADNLSLGASAQFDSDVTTWVGSLRFNF